MTLLGRSFAGKQSASNAWGKFVGTFLTTFVGALVFAVLLILLIDPYDTGYFPSLSITGVDDGNQRTASASRGRDPQFNAAIFGNSRGQMLNPARLSEASDARFVQLTVPGTGAREQLTLMKWFVQHHPRPFAIVLVADQVWCEQNADLPLINPFPFWLYEGRAAYVLNIFNGGSLSRVWRRMMLAIGKRQASDPSGFSDYEIGKIWSFQPSTSAKAAQISGQPRSHNFPAIDSLQKLMAAHLIDRLIVVTPPTHISAIPQGGEDADLLNACKRRLSDVVSGSQRGGFVDFLVDVPINRDAKNFMDATHYRSNVAIEIEKQIVEILREESRFQVRRH